MAFIEIYNPPSAVLSQIEEIGTWFRITVTTTLDVGFQITTTSTTVLSAVIYAKTNNLLMGTSADQTFPMTAGDSLSVEKVDLSTIYVKNATPGSDIVVEVVGTKRS